MSKPYLVKDLPGKVVVIARQDMPATWRNVGPRVSIRSRSRRKDAFLRGYRMHEVCGRCDLDTWLLLLEGVCPFCRSVLHLWVPEAWLSGGDLVFADEEATA